MASFIEHRFPGLARCAVALCAVLLLPVQAHAVPTPVVDHDFGDAPDSYQTVLASDGARHRNDVPGLFLGLGVDLEADGQPSVSADGDDLADIDDEDGVVFTTAVVAGSNATLDVTASAQGLLNAWFDFDLDGTWSGIGEQIFVDTALAAGSNSLIFAVPTTTVVGESFARFRFGSAGGLSFTGGTPDGEVEDYRVTVSAQPTPGPATLGLVVLGVVAVARARTRRG